MLETQNKVIALIEEVKKQLHYLKFFGFQEIPAQIPSDIIYHQKKEPPPLEKIEKEVEGCKRCKLSSARTHIVFGVGNQNADILFIGEGPGQEEDLKGIPFVGKAGQLLTQIIEKGMGLKRSDVYICNIVKCRPPANRDPEEEEIEACRGFLEKQIKAINPKIIVALGKPASSTLLERNVMITRERGTWHKFMGYKVMITYHPAFLLRFYTKENRSKVWEDMKKVLAAL